MTFNTERLGAAIGAERELDRTLGEHGDRRGGRRYRHCRRRHCRRRRGEAQREAGAPAPMGRAQGDAAHAHALASSRMQFTMARFSSAPRRASASSMASAAAGVCA